jgi:hypothetical protein
MATLDFTQLGNDELIGKFNELKVSFQTETDINTKNLLNNQLGEIMFEITQRNLSL